MLKFLAAEEFTFWRDCYIAAVKHGALNAARFADDSVEEIRKRLPEPTPIEPDPGVEA